MGSLDQTLINAGLSEKETRVYLAALELGKSTATQISRKAGVNRATTYIVADNLMLRGLMSSLEQDAKRFFVAEPPDRLLSRLQKEEDVISTHRQELAEVMPELEAMVKGDSTRPIVRYYEGLKGLDAMRDILYQHRHDEIISAVDLDRSRLYLPIENIREHQRKLKLYDLGGRVLYTCTDETAAKILTESLARKTHEHRRVSREDFPFQAEVVIFGKTVALVSYGERIVGAIIDHPDFAGSMRSLYELAWKNAEPKK